MEKVGHREQETLRLSLMSDAVSIAASAVFFTLRLLDSTLDLYFDATLKAPLSSPTTFHPSVQHFKVFLLFKQSEELRTLSLSLVHPLLLMRVLSGFKDVYLSFFTTANDSLPNPEGHRFLDMVDVLLLVFASVWTFAVIPPLETQFISLEDPNLVASSFDELEFAHLISLSQAGLLTLLSLLKLFARLERASLSYQHYHDDDNEDDDDGVVEEPKLIENEESTVNQVEERVQQVVVIVKEEEANEKKPTTEMLWKRVDVENAIPSSAVRENNPKEEKNDDGKYPLWVGALVSTMVFVLVFRRTSGKI